MLLLIDIQFLCVDFHYVDMFMSLYVQIPWFVTLTDALPSLTDRLSPVAVASNRVHLLVT